MAFDSILGATLIGGIVTAMRVYLLLPHEFKPHRLINHRLYGALCVQCYIFFQRLEEEALLLKTTVSLLPTPDFRDSRTNLYVP